MGIQGGTPRRGMREAREDTGLRATAAGGFAKLVAPLGFAKAATAPFTSASSSANAAAETTLSTIADNNAFPVAL